MERRPWRLRVCAVRVWKQPNHGKDLGFGDCFEMDIVDQCVSKLYPTISIYVFPAPTSITVCQFRQLLYRFKSSPVRIYFFPNNSMFNFFNPMIISSYPVRIYFPQEFNINFLYVFQPRSLPLCATATIHHHVYHICSYHFR